VIFFHGDLVTGVASTGGALLITLYRPRAVGRPRAGAWSLSLDGPARLAACGPAVCVVRPGSGTTVVDPDRGRPRTSTPDPVVGQLGGGLLLATASETGTGVVDPYDGGRIASYPGLLPVPWTDAGGRALLGGPTGL